MTTTSVRPEPLIKLGRSTVTEHVGGEQTNRAVALLEFTIEPGFPVPPPHAHTHEDEITYVIEGRPRDHDRRRDTHARRRRVDLQAARRPACLRDCR